jgi:hypothetical protein
LDLADEEGNSHGLCVLSKAANLKAKYLDRPKLRVQKLNNVPYLGSEFVTHDNQC